MNERVNTNFLRQRSPFLFYCNPRGDGTIEFAGIDYLLPYRMARRYGVVAEAAAQ